MINIKDKDFLLAFGKHLRKLRKSKGLTQEKLGFLAEVSKNQVGEIERGEINPTICTLKVLANALEVELKEMMDF